ncbi:hypothetical protein JOF28_001589 [Leucobacter exalbidus]|uniref:Uncharacterized protein n=1 Tax=Leucobacter exalbidus TaxID=662960 RepID=A0A940T3P1_9MICO|nr:hypothetical protein [Leucobacter exalbidus]
MNVGQWEIDWCLGRDSGGFAIAHTAQVRGDNLRPSLSTGIPPDRSQMLALIY